MGMGVSGGEEGARRGVLFTFVITHNDCCICATSVLLNNWLTSDTWVGVGLRYMGMGVSGGEEGARRGARVIYGC
jgi:6-phosphogluconate dehydrogenase